MNYSANEIHFRNAYEGHVPEELRITSIGLPTPDKLIMDICEPYIIDISDPQNIDSYSRERIQNLYGDLLNGNYHPYVLKYSNALGYSCYCYNSGEIWLQPDELDAMTIYFDGNDSMRYSAHFTFNGEIFSSCTVSSLGTTLTTNNAGYYQGYPLWYTYDSNTGDLNFFDHEPV